MKKITRLCLMGIMFSACITGCGAASAGSAAESSTAVNAAATEDTTAAESQIATEAAMDQEAVKDTSGESVDASEVPPIDAAGILLTTGTYEGDSDFVDEDQALFTDENGIEFVAQISDSTNVPEDGLVKGQTYVVVHSEMMTASLPGIYPEVYAIMEQS